MKIFSKLHNARAVKSLEMMLEMMHIGDHAFRPNVRIAVQQKTLR